MCVCVCVLYAWWAENNAVHIHFQCKTCMIFVGAWVQNWSLVDSIQKLFMLILVGLVFGPVPIIFQLLTLWEFKLEWYENVKECQQFLVFFPKPTPKWIQKSFYTKFRFIFFYSFSKVFCYFFVSHLKIAFNYNWCNLNEKFERDTLPAVFHI